MPAMNAIILGFLLGAVASGVGGLLSYWFGLRRTEGPTAVPLVYLFLVGLFLGIVGVLALMVGVLSGTVMQALLGGIGVIAGFSIAFAFMIFLWIRFGD